MKAVESLCQDVGTKAACDALDVSRATFYRWLRGKCQPQKLMPKAVCGCSCLSACQVEVDAQRPAPPLALSDAQRQQALDVLRSEPFADKAPYEVYAALLDQGVYLCSIRTMYRILEAEGEVRERRNQLRHPHYQKPELIATEPNQVWSWDITKLKGPAKWVYYYLYVIMDIFSRYVVGWMVAHRESETLAKRLIDQTCSKQDIVPGHLTIHADRGSSMTSKSVAQLMADLGITKTHSRPHVSNDNPYSEAQFKTLKYRPGFPERFGSIEDSRAFCQNFFPWYNTEHYHTGIGLLTPESVHYGWCTEIIEARAEVLLQAFQANPQRFKGKKPKPPELPQAAWINRPKPADGDVTIRH